LTKCSLHLTFLLLRPEGRKGHEYVVKKLPIAEYSVVKKPSEVALRRRSKL
jgi:hypothetical protein